MCVLAPVPAGSNSLHAISPTLLCEAGWLAALLPILSLTPTHTFKPSVSLCLVAKHTTKPTRQGPLPTCTGCISAQTPWAKQHLGSYAVGVGSPSISMAPPPAVLHYRSCIASCILPTCAFCAVQHEKSESESEVALDLTLYNPI